MSDDDISIGDRVRLARETANLTQAQLAEMMGISRSFLTHLEAGNREWSVTMLKRAARALGLRASRLLPPERVNAHVLAAG